MQPFAIVGYLYRAEILCPSCTIRALPTGPGEAFDGWADCSEPPMSAESNLSEIAAAFGIDRDDEGSFDSGDFPKIVFRSDLHPDGVLCAGCEHPFE